MKTKEENNNLDYSCPICKNETQSIKGYEKDCDRKNFKMVYCKEHGLILFEKKHKGMVGNIKFYWEMKMATNFNFTCNNCIYWNINKHSRNRNDFVYKECELNIPIKDNPYSSMGDKFRDSNFVACEKFKHKEVKNES